jgi:hypothetical protein
MRRYYRARSYIEDLKAPGCANPDCKNHDVGVEVHHIQPIKHSGSDTRDNMIQLCCSCHHIPGLHADWEKHAVREHVWKLLQEERYGFHRVRRVIPDTKVCNRCGKKKSAGEFYNVTLASGNVALATPCKECQKLIKKTRRVEYSVLCGR